MGLQAGYTRLQAGYTRLHARYTNMRLQVDPNFMNEAAGRIQRLRDRLRRWERLAGRFYLENPETGQLKSYLGHPKHRFDPCDFGLYLPKDDTHPVKGFPPRDRYRKRTGLWVGDGFRFPKRRILKAQAFSVQDVAQHERSHTPRGFARAVCLANCQLV